MARSCEITHTHAKTQKDASNGSAISTWRITELLPGVKNNAKLAKSMSHRPLSLLTKPPIQVGFLAANKEQEPFLVIPGPDFRYRCSLPRAIWSKAIVIAADDLFRPISRVAIPIPRVTTP